MRVAETEAIRLKLEQLKELDQEGNLALDLENTTKFPPGTWRWLSEHPEDAAELAELLNEAAPTLGLQNYPKLTPPRTPLDLPRWQTVHASTLLKERLHAAVPIALNQINWSNLAAVITSETIAFEELVGGPDDCGSATGAVATTPDASSASTKAQPFQLPMTPGGSLVEVNSGGRVLFCLFTLDQVPTAPAFSSSSPLLREGCVVLKFVSSRLLCQSEQFANELARHVGICSPETRIVRAAASSSDPEWSEVVKAAERIHPTYPELLEEINECTSFLVLEYIPGKGLFRTPMPFHPLSPDTFSDIGRVFALDTLLGNADRLSCQALGWRGNPENILFATSGRWEGRLVAIDAVVQRRPPGGLLSAEDAACERLVELMLNDQEIAEKVLSEAVGSSPAATNLLEDPNTASAAVEAFQNGLRRGLQATDGLKGLLEMMFEVVTEWIDEFIDDIEGIASTPSVPPNTARRIGSAGANNPLSINTQNCGQNGGGGLTLAGIGNMGGATGGIAGTLTASIPTQSLQSPAVTTFKIRRINLEATHNRSVGDRVSEWKTIFRTKAEDLRAAVEEWQAKRGNQNNTNESHTYNYQKEKIFSKASSFIGSDDDLAESEGHGGLSRKSSDKEKATEKDSPKKRNVNVDFDQLEALAAHVSSPRSAPASSGAKLTTGFLDGTAPIVDIYELKVRLEHMLQRLRVLQQATATARPTRLLPGLYLSGAVEASSLHLLRYYGITHVLNATEDLLLPEETQSFVGMRIPLRDVEEEDISPYFTPAATFIDSALESGGGVLVHCHAGRSRSCSLVLAWLMTRRNWTLKQALEFLHDHRPQAAPNAGYLQQLSALEAELFGTQTVKIKKTKPAPRKCPECGDVIGLSAESVRVHLRLKHPSKAQAYYLNAADKSIGSTALGTASTAHSGRGQENNICQR
jgi:atypical dual specificity phosphatase